MANAHNGKQSDATRKEMLVALQYLLEKCYDEEHTSSTVELTAYAEKQDIYLDRRRANDIFDSLVEFTKGSSILPYKVIKVAKKPRYYIQKCFFTNDEIKGIASAIDNDSRITKDEADAFVDAFLNKVCTESQKKQVLSKIRKGVAKKHISSTQNSSFKILETLMNKGWMFAFRLKNPSNFLGLDCTNPTRDLITNIYKGVWLEGFVYDVIREHKSAVIYLSKPYYCAMIVKTDNIEYNDQYNPHGLWAPLEYILKGSKYATIDEWVEKYYQGEVGLQTEVKFKFWVGSNNEQLRAIGASYHKYFKKKMMYSLSERKVVRTLPNGEQKEVTATDAVTSVTCNFNSFKNWYWKEGAFESVVILSPKHWNNRLLSNITERFQNRIKKYGIDLSADATNVRMFIKEQSNKAESPAASNQATEEKVESRFEMIKPGK